MLKSRNIFFAALIGFFALYSYACTEDKSKAQANASEPMVYAMKSFTKSTDKTKPSDFSWTMDGKTVSLYEFTKGKVVFLNFWGTWCGPCRREIPEIIELVKELKDKNVVFIGMPSEHDPTEAEKIKNVTSFAKANKINYMNVVSSMQLMQAYNVNAVPTTFIIDKKGNISETIVGGRSKAEFLKSIEKAMK